MAVALSTCLIASATIFVARSGSAPGVLLAAPPTGFMDPEVYLDHQSHVRFVRSTAAAEDMYANDVKVNVPCSWGIRCQLHVRPTLRERTDGAWLGDGKVTPLHNVKPDRLTGPWSQKFAKHLPRPAGGGWGDQDRAANGNYHGNLGEDAVQVKQAAAPTSAYYVKHDYKQILGQRTPTPPKAVSPSVAETKQQLEEKKEAAKEKADQQKLEEQAKAIRAQMAKMLDSYGQAAIKTDNGYHP